MCGEDQPDEALPNYPQYAGDLEAYSHAQELWAVQAAGVYKRERIKRNATTTCINDLRKRGIIN